MIDIHAHIIPGVDDGADSLDMALEMLRTAEADGIEAVVAAPHTFSSLSVFKSPEPLKEKFLLLKSEAEQNKVNIDILQGAENFFHSRLQEYLAEWRELLTINNSDYFLLEFPKDFIFPGTGQFIHNVMQDRFIPIICHPERNRVFQEDPSLLYQFLQMGALCQITAGSLRGDFGPDTRDTALDFMKCNMVHVIASDSHHSQFHRTEMAFVYNELKEMDRQWIDILTHTIPRAIINNEALPDTGPMIDPARSTSIFKFFKEMFQ